MTGVSPGQSLAWSRCYLLTEPRREQRDSPCRASAVCRPSAALAFGHSHGPLPGLLCPCSHTRPRAPGRPAGQPRGWLTATCHPDGCPGETGDTPGHGVVCVDRSAASTPPGRSGFRSPGRGHTVRWRQHHAVGSARANLVSQLKRTGDPAEAVSAGGRAHAGPSRRRPHPAPRHRVGPEARLVEERMTGKPAENMHAQAALCRAGRLLRCALRRKTTKNAG